MKIELYTISDDPRSLNKNLGEGREVSCSVYGSIDVENPVFVVDNQTEAGSLSGCNYVKCSEFGRYYFASVTFDKHKAIISCHSDVLTSFGIKNTTQHIVRQENSGITRVIDSNIVVLEKRWIDAVETKVAPFAPSAFQLPQCIFCLNGPYDTDSNV